MRLGAEIVVTREIESIAPSATTHVVTLDGGRTLTRARRDPRDRRLLPGAAGRRARRLRRHRRVLRRGAHRGGRDAGAATSSSSAAATRPGRRRSSSPTTRARVTILIRGESLDGVDVAVPDRRARAQAERARPHGRRDRRAARATRASSASPIRNRADGSLDEVDAHALFIFIGADANTGWLPKEVICDERGFVCTGRDVTDLMPEAWPLERDPYLLETSVPGHLRGRRRAPRQHQARRLGRRRGQHRHRVRARAPGRARGAPRGCHAAD